MKKSISLKKATRNQLIKELVSRNSITSYKVLPGNGAVIKTVSGNISVNDESHIFVITPNKNTTTENSDVSVKKKNGYIVEVSRN
ncbi:hypothetical protein [Erysipelothrix anatis]|uniref:hypothetical protein n=1 Tax=Erysipelothrix anatis TaxID=2683713 RepID=UPI00135A0DA0|nr:hypothetical protein [Erysipelothrix anatis]